MAVTPFKSSDNFNMAGFNEKITEADNTYVAKTGDSMSGALSMGNNKITDVANPVNDGDAVNKGYVDNPLAGYTKIVTLTDQTLHQVNVNSSKILEILCVFNNFSYDSNDPDPIIRFYSNTAGTIESIVLTFLMYYSSKSSFTNASFAIRLIPSAISLGNESKIAFVAPYLYNASANASYYMHMNTTSLSVKEYNKINGTVDIYMKLLP